MTIKSFLSHRKFKWFLVISIIFVWLGISAVGGPTFGKLSTVANNDQASYLPSSADSTKVANLESKFITNSQFPAVVLITSNKFAPTDYVKLSGMVSGFRQIPAVGSNPSNVLGPIPSKDGKALEYIVSVNSLDKIQNTVATMTNVVNKNISDNQKGYVTGTVGLASALFKAFAGIDGKLIYVTLVVVFVILLLVYRAIILPFLVLGTALFALSGAGLVVYHGVLWNWFKLNGQSQGILSILVIGACTDYSLLLTSRFREALTHHESKFEAMAFAWKRSFEPILASGLTVILGLLCLIFSDLNSNKGLGPVAASGIVFAVLSALTFLPAFLAILGRKAFWPFVPKFLGIEEKVVLKNGLEDRSGFWKAVSEFVAKRSRILWITLFILLIASAFNLTQFKATGVTQLDSILGQSNAVDGQNELSKHFPAGSGSPLIVIASKDKAVLLINKIESNKGIISAVPVVDANKQIKVVNNQIMINVTLDYVSGSAASQEVVMKLRNELPSIDKTALVGGSTAVSLDVNNNAKRDLRVITPLILFVILIILIVLLRSLVAPVILILSVILSFTATIGISAFLFNHVFHFPGSDASIPLYGFVFLVALGVDYNIFLMTRVREESLKLGTHSGILRGLSVTGSVITYAGVVLASTFAALGVIPILFLLEIAFIVAFGVLLDTLIVRTLLVPALSYDLGKYIWWPNIPKKDR
jgi:RND superfamily putative drug exporter